MRRRVHELADIFECERPALVRYARRMLGDCADEAEDVVQEAWVRLQTLAARGETPYGPPAWLRTTVRNQCLDVHRAARVRLADGSAAPEPCVGGDPTFERVEVRGAALAALEDVSRLPDRQREVLLAAGEGLSHAEVGERLGCSPMVSRALLVRARGNVRKTAAARELPCGEVRDALERANERGVRPSELARRHLWACASCATYRQVLPARSWRERVAAWLPFGGLLSFEVGGKVAACAGCVLATGGLAALPPAAPRPVVAEAATPAPRTARVAPTATPAPTVPSVVAVAVATATPAERKAPARRVAPKPEPRKASEPRRAEREQERVTLTPMQTERKRMERMREVKVRKARPADLQRKFEEARRAAAAATPAAAPGAPAVEMPAPPVETPAVAATPEPTPPPAPTAAPAEPALEAAPAATVDPVPTP